MTALIKTAELVIILSVLILFHELGHCLFAKLFGIRVDKFYLFFDVGGKRIFSTKHNRLIEKYFPKLHNATTDYGIGWLPLGGYCKIHGMIDESMDLEQMKEKTSPDEFRSHPAWQRLLVMSGGVLFNFILAIGIYIGILANTGKQYIANEGNAIYAGELAQRMGFRTGDRILSYDDYTPVDFGMLQADLARRSPRMVTVLRDGGVDTIYMDRSMLSEILSTREMFDLAIPFVVDSVPSSSINSTCVLTRGDRLYAIEDTSITYTVQSRKMLENYVGQTVDVSFIRGSDSLATQLQVDSNGLFGIVPVIPGIVTEEYSLLEAIPAGFTMTFENIGGYIRDLKLVFTPSTQAYKSVGSFIAMGQAMPSQWSWILFFHMMAMLSIMLGVMNLIPIPALDGGHIVITLYEMVSGRKPSDTFLTVTQMIGMVLIILLMILAFGNDIGRLIGM